MHVKPDAPSSAGATPNAATGAAVTAAVTGAAPLDAAAAAARAARIDALIAADARALHGIIEAAAPLDLDALADSSYTGIDLSLPRWMHALLWRTFRKTFYRDPATGVLRGWNVKVEQTGWATPPAPRRDRQGAPLAFGHYEVRSARGLRFPRGWQGAHYLEYRYAGNALWDWPARAGRCPLVAVDAGSMELLLGWEIFRFGPADSVSLDVPLPDYWLLVREGPLAPDARLPRPDARRMRPDTQLSLSDARRSPADARLSPPHAGEGLG